MWSMAKTYAAVWQRDDAPRRVGKLAVARTALRFEGAQPGVADAGDLVRAGDITAVAIERSPAERLDGLPTIVVRLRGGLTVRVASLDGPGTVHEIVGLVSALAFGANAA